MTKFNTAPPPPAQGNNLRTPAGTGAAEGGDAVMRHSIMPAPAAPKILRLLPCLCAAVTALLAVYCRTYEFGEPVKPQAPKYSVYFYDIHDSVTAWADTVVVDSGKTIGVLDFPADPVRDSLVFEGWFDADSVQYFDTTVIVQSVSLFARWKDTTGIVDITPPDDTVRYTVKFNTNGGTPAAIDSVVVDSGTTLGTKYPAAPTKAEHIFDGWFDGNSIQYYATTPVVENVTLAVVWKDTASTIVITPPDTVRYVVKFNTNGGTPAIIDSAVVDSGTTLGDKYPADPTKAGYLFDGWIDGGSIQYYAITTVVGNVTLNAVWKDTASAVPVKQFAVTFNTGGGTPAAIDPVIVDSGATLGAQFPADPTKAEYVFGGWFDGTAQYTNTTVIVKHAALTAEWKDTASVVTVKQFAVAFNTNGGTPAAIDPVIVDSGTTLGAKFPADPTKAGNTFEGWFDGSVEYTGTTGILKNVMLLATWEDTASAVPVKQFAVAFHTNGGTPAIIDPVTVDSGAVLGANFPDAPARTGYTFNGWFGGTTPYNAATQITGNMTLTANWTPITYTISYTLNSGTVATANPASYTVETATFILTNPTRTNYTFTGWTGANGSTPQTSVSVTLGSSGNRTYTANWTPITYTISYTLNNGTVATANPASYTVETATFTLTNPTRTNYTFAGWTGANGSTPQTSVSVTLGSTGDRSYTANWTAVTYTITYNLDGGTVATANPTSYNITTAAFTLNNPTRTGYTFAGWTGANGATAQTSVSVPLGSTGNRSYTANWTIITYTITYTLNNGTVATANPTSYNVTTQTITLRNPTRANYVFAGWTGSNGTTPQTTVTIPLGSTGNRSYTANWTLTTYTITYTMNSGTVTTANPTSYTIETPTFTLRNPARLNYGFTGWSGTNGATPQMTVSVLRGSTGNRNYTANFHASCASGSFVTSTHFCDARDDNKYKYVKIGNQTWMAQNLNYAAVSPIIGACYNNDVDTCGKYGRLYTWSEVMNISASYNTTTWGGSVANRQGICPAGWHVPSDAEWTTLINFVGTNPAPKLKSKSGWWNADIALPGTDEYGFEARPGGHGLGTGFDSAGDDGYWWSATEAAASLAWYRGIYHFANYLDRDEVNKARLFSVRCIQN